MSRSQRPLILLNESLPKVTSPFIRISSYFTTCKCCSSREVEGDIYYPCPSFPQDPTHVNSFPGPSGRDPPTPTGEWVRPGHSYLLVQCTHRHVLLPILVSDPSLWGYNLKKEMENHQLEGNFLPPHSTLSISLAPSLSPSIISGTWLNSNPETKEELPSSRL